LPPGTRPYDFVQPLHRRSNDEAKWIRQESGRHRGPAWRMSVTPVAKVSVSYGENAV